jgi:DNA-binding NarL/FixJ family response regulator
LAEITIVVADSQKLFCAALGRALDRETDLRLVGEARNAGELMATTATKKPDVVLLDPGLSGPGIMITIRSILERHPEARVVVLPQEDDAELLVSALQEGAAGYLPKDRGISELIKATRVVHRGETQIPRHMMGSLVSRLMHGARERERALRRIFALSPQERVVLRALAEGRPSAEIARRLVLSPNTVRTHVQNILTKLGVHSRLEAVAFVTMNDLLEDLPA